MTPRTLELLRDTAIFEQLSDPQLGRIEQRLINLKFEAGDLVFREGAPGRYICFIIEGELEVLKDTADGESIPIATLVAGHSVGEMSIIDGLTCSATVISRTPARVLALTREDFDLLVDEEPRLGTEIFRGISRLLSMSLRKTSADLAAARAR
jgi:CRP-like cAMP-binding protein